MLQQGPLNVRLGPFLVTEPLGKGGMARVWRGRHEKQGVEVAIKVMDARVSRSAKWRDSFRDEIRAVAGLQHPGIILVFDHGLVDGATSGAANGQLPARAPWLAMELAQRGSLDRLDEVLSWPELKSLLLSLLDALAHAHARGVVHRDLKPANVLLGSASDHRPGIKLTDFGLAHAMDRFQERSGVSGTPRYMAPEQFRSEWRDYGPWTDLYALGCVAWELSTGRPPMWGKDMTQLGMAHLYFEPPEFVPRRPVAGGFEGWLLRLLEKDPRHRFQRAADAAWALASLLDPVQDELGVVPESPTVISNPTLTLDDTFFSELNSRASTVRDQMAPLPALADEGSGRSAQPMPATVPPTPTTWRRPTPRPPSIQLIGAGLGLYGLRAIPLVDRDQERGAIWAGLREARLAKGLRVLALRGAAGNGKSRLVQWMSERAHELGAATVLKAVHSPRAGAVDGLARMVARELRCIGLSRAQVEERLMEGKAAEGFAEDSEVRAVVELIEPAPDDFEGKVVRFGTTAERYVIVQRLLARRAAKRPVLVWLDDVQWGLDALNFVRHLQDAADTGPVLLLLTVQEEALAERDLERAVLDEVLAHASAAPVPIGPLGPDDRSELVRELLGLSGSLATRVEQRSAGNPLFAVQLVGDWVTRELLVPGESGFELRPGAETALPDDLHQVWSQRIDRLFGGQDSEGRVALELAAALGQDVDQVEWEQACARAGITIPDDLVERLANRRLAADGEGGWSFAHGMIRESLERDARARGRWERLNGAAADLLAEQEHGGARLGRHLLLAGRPQDAVGPLLDGARELVEAREYDAAAALLDERAQAMKTAGVPRSDARHGEGWLVRARLLDAMGRTEACEGEARRAEKAARRHGWERVRPRALERLAQVERARGSLRNATQLFQDAVAAWVELGAPSDEARARRGLCWVHILAGELPAAKREVTAARAIWEASGDDANMAHAWRSLGDIARLELDWDTSADCFQKAMAAFARQGDRARYAANLHGLAEIQRLRGELDEAEKGYRRCIEIHALTGDNDDMPNFNLGLCLMAKEQWARAREAFERVGARWEKQGKHGYVGLVRVVSVPTAAALSDWADYDRLFSEATASLGSSGMVDIDVAQAMELAGQLAHDRGQPERARKAWEVALDQWEQLGEEASVERLEAKL